MAAVGKFVLWGKENLCLIRAQGDTLALQTLFYAEDVRAKNEIEEAVEATKIQKAELGLAGQVIDSLVGEWHIEDFQNEYRGELKAMLEAKLAGEEIKRPEPVAETPVIDLMEALRRSVEEVQGGKGRKAKAESRLAGRPEDRAREEPALGHEDARRARAR